MTNQAGSVLKLPIAFGAALGVGVLGAAATYGVYMGVKDNILLPKANQDFRSLCASVVSEELLKRSKAMCDTCKGEIKTYLERCLKRYEDCLVKKKKPIEDALRQHDALREQMREFRERTIRIVERLDEFPGLM